MRGPLDAARVVNLTQIAERLPRPDGPRQPIRILEHGARGPIFEVVSHDATGAAAAWPEEAAAGDTIYIVIAGEGRLRCGDEAMDCAAGDVLFAPAGIPRRFEALGRGFAIWRVLLGAG